MKTKIIGSIGIALIVGSLIGKKTSFIHYYIYNNDNGTPMEVNLKLYKEFGETHFTKKNYEYNLENALSYGVLTFGVLLTLSSILSKKNS